MSAFDPLSPEVVYCLKGNVAYPVVGAASLATLAANRIKDEYTESNGSQTQHVSAITVAAQTNVNQ